jgi:hypothetical protein
MIKPKAYDHQDRISQLDKLNREIKVLEKSIGNYDTIENAKAEPVRDTICYTTALTEIDRQILSGRLKKDLNGEWVEVPEELPESEVL